MQKPFYKSKWILIPAVLIGFLILFLGVTAGTVSGARRRKLNTTPTPSVIPTAEPTATPLPNYYALSFEPDLSKMEGMNAVPEEYREELGAAYWVDVTPVNEPVTGYTLFRHVELGYSFLLLPDGRYLRLGERTEGCGIVNGLFADLDANDVPELVYAYTVESEDGPAARVGWLDLGTLENRTAPFQLNNSALALGDEDGRLILYRADLLDTDSRGFYTIDFIAPLGEVKELDGALFLELR